MFQKNFLPKAFIWMVIIFIMTACNLPFGDSNAASDLPSEIHQGDPNTVVPSADETLTSTNTLPPTLIPTGTDIPVQVESVEYIHLRIEFTSQSDWADVTLLTPDNLLAVSEVATSGAPNSTIVNADMLGITQPIGSAESGVEVGLVADYAFHKDTNELEFKLTKGDLNGCEVKFYAVVGDEAMLLATFKHYNIVPNSQGINPYTFTLTLSEYPDFQLNSKEVQRFQVPKMVWAFYYPWYEMGHWYSNILIDRPLTPYYSGDPAAITRHIEQAQNAGIDGFISSWWGPNSPDTNPNLQLLLDLAQERGFAVSIYFETMTGDGPLPEHRIKSWLQYLILTYGDHPAFYKINGRPLIALWASSSVPNETWARIIEQLEEEGLEAFYLGLGYSATNLDVFDGYHEYGAFYFEDLPQVFSHAERMAHYYPLLKDSSEAKLFAATVQPGYDDRLIPDRGGGQMKDREDGDFFRHTFESALSTDPDWIFISTWNEWWEHTHIEPSENWGDLFLQITLEYANLWKEGQ